MTFFNDNAVAIQSLTTLSLVVITGVYVYITAKILRANKEANDILKKEHELNSRPHILVTLSFRHGIIVNLLIKNIGKSIAENVRLSLDRDFFVLGDASQNLKDFTIFKKPIKNIMPGMEYLITLGQGWLFFDTEEKKAVLPKSFQVTAEYSYSNKKVKEVSIIDIAPFKNTLAVKDEFLEEVEKLRKDITKVLEAIKNKLP